MFCYLSKKEEEEEEEEEEENIASNASKTKLFDNSFHIQQLKVQSSKKKKNEYMKSVYQINGSNILLQTIFASEAIIHFFFTT